MHAMGLKGNDEAKGIAHLWTLGSIGPWPTLKFNNYQSWVIRVVLSDADKETLGGLLAHGIPGRKWDSSALDNVLTVSTNKEHVNKHGRGSQRRKYLDPRRLACICRRLDKKDQMVRFGKDLVIFDVEWPPHSCRRLAICVNAHLSIF